MLAKLPSGSMNFDYLFFQRFQTIKYRNDCKTMTLIIGEDERHGIWTLHVMKQKNGHKLLFLCFSLVWMEDGP